MEIDDIVYRKLTCAGCGLDLATVEAEQIEVEVDLSESLVFAGGYGKKRVRAFVCPECQMENPVGSA